MSFYIIIAILSVLSFYLSWVFLNNPDNIGPAKSIYFSGLWGALVFIDNLTWRESSQSVFRFYICIFLVLIVYLFFYSYSLCFF